MLLSLNSDKAAFWILTDKKGVIFQLDLNTPTAETDYDSLTKKNQKIVDKAVMEGVLTTQGTEDLE